VRSPCTKAQGRSVSSIRSLYGSAPATQGTFRDFFKLPMTMRTYWAPCSNIRDGSPGRIGLTSTPQSDACPPSESSRRRGRSYSDPDRCQVPEHMREMPRIDVALREVQLLGIAPSRSSCGRCARHSDAAPRSCGTAIFLSRRHVALARR
jgi:hypothetical protein